MKLYNIVVLVFFVIMSKANAQNKDFNSEYIKLPLDVEIIDSNKKKLKLKKIFYHERNLTHFLFERGVSIWVVYRVPRGESRVQPRHSGEWHPPCRVPRPPG